MKLLTLIFVLCGVTSCGAAKFIGANGKATGGSADEPIEQPADVAGGLGLTCVASPHTDDESKTDFNCSFSDKSGNKFKERDDLKLDLQVKIGDKVITVTVSTFDNVSSFSFTVEENEVEKVQIVTKFINPKEDNKTLKDQISELKNVIVSTDIANSWEDLSPEGKCSIDSKRCILKLKSSNLIVSGVQSGSDMRSWEPWDDAESKCAGLELTDAHPRGSWSLPSSSQLQQASANSVRSVRGWRGAADINVHFWSSDEYNRSQNSAYTASMLNATVGWSLKTNNLQFFCVKKDQQPTQQPNPTLQACTGSCYPAPNFAQDLPLGTERAGPSGVAMILTYANGVDGFKIWKEKGGSRFLNASGKVLMGWQRKLESNGILFATSSNTDSAELKDFASITGRACPDYVFSRGAARNDQTCVYYTSDLSPPGQDLNITKWNDPSTREGSNVSWFDTNSSLCGAKGMRLPTAYEVGATQIGGSNFMPSDSSPESPEDVDADKNVPLISSMLAGVQLKKGIWTATGSTRDENNYFALVPAGTGTMPPSNRVCANVLNPSERCLMDFPRSDMRFGIRCVLPGF